MNKITAEHLARRACVYVRQSTPDQVQHNLESRRRQYALVDRARALGWKDVDVIDDDLRNLRIRNTPPRLRTAVAHAMRGASWRGLQH